MEEQTNVRILLSQTQEEVKKAISGDTQRNDASRLAILKEIDNNLTDLSQQFEYGKLSYEDTQKELSKMIERIKNIN